MSANVRKVTLAIGKGEYAWATRRAKVAGTSVSAVLTAAARDKREAEARDALQRRAWREILTHVTGKSPLTAKELSSAERELG